MSYTYAGQYNPEALIDVYGNVQPGIPLTLYEPDGVTLSTRYTDRTKATTVSNPWVSSGIGEVTFFANPGPHVLSILVEGVETRKTITIPIDPAEAAQDADVVAAINRALAFSLIFGA